MSRISALLDDRETAEPALYAIKGCCDLLGNIHMMKYLLESTCVSVSAMSVLVIFWIPGEAAKLSVK